MTDAQNVGTNTERRRRRQYLALLGAGLIFAFALGLGGRVSTGPQGTIAPALAIILVLGLSLLIVGGTWIYSRRVDELQWANNLFACFWGFNAFILAVPAWLILKKGGLAPEPDIFTIYIGAAAIAAAAYLWKKYR